MNGRILERASVIGVVTIVCDDRDHRHSDDCNVRNHGNDYDCDGDKIN